MLRARFLYFSMSVCLALTATAALGEQRQLAELPLRADGALPVKLVSSGRCMFGDYDLIAADLLAAEVPSLLLTIEPFGAAPQPPLAAAVLHTAGTGGRITSAAGYDLDLTLPPNLSAQLLALYICRDRLGSGTCGDKPLLPFNAALKPHTVKGGATEDPGDKIYYFELLILSSGKVHFPDTLFSEDLLARMPVHIRAVLGSSLDPAAFARFCNTAKTLLSEPLAINAGRLQIDLPRIDRVRCGQLRVPPGR